MALSATFTTMIAQDIKLPAPQTAGGLPVNQVLAERHSVREFNPDAQLPQQTVADLLWAACGINRPETGYRTNPTARNVQEIVAFWFDASGAYRYDPKDNVLVKVADGDHRNLIAGNADFSQEFVLEAPASIVLVAETDKIAMNACLIDAGIACENINLFCGGNGLATVPRMTMDADAIRKVLNLPETAIPLLNNPVGFAR